MATCSSVAQSGLRCAPHRSIVPKPSARRAEQGVEAIGVGFERREHLVGRAVAVRPFIAQPVSRATSLAVTGDRPRRRGTHSAAQPITAAPRVPGEAQIFASTISLTWRAAFAA